MAPAIRLFSLLIVLGLVSQTSAAQMQVFFSAAREDTLYESSTGDVSNAAGEHLFAGTTAQGEIRRAVLAFDIAGNVPAGATIDSVRLAMAGGDTISSRAHPATLHRITRQWGEGTSGATGEEGAGGVAASGDATWIHAFFDSQTWSSPGGDFDTTTSATAIVGDVAFYSCGPTATMTSDVQTWLDDDTQNFGWIVIGNEDGTGTVKRYASRESWYPPQLWVYYSVATSIEDSPESPAAVSLSPLPLRWLRIRQEWRTGSLRRPTSSQVTWWLSSEGHIWSTSWRP